MFSDSYIYKYRFIKDTNQFIKQKALSMDDSEAFTHAALGYIYSKMRKYEKAIASGKRSVELDPNNAFAICLYGSPLADSERFDEAIVYLNRANRLNPFPPYYYYLHLGRCYGRKEQHADALKEFKKALQRSPNAGYVHLVLAITYINLDREEEARASAKKRVAMIDSMRRSVAFVRRHD
jgi:adenylate cyclase